MRQIVGGGVEVAPVVKSDAYRHGAVEVSRILANEGARWFCVSNPEEGIQLRESGIAGRLLVMADFLPFERKTLLEFGLTPVIHTLGEVPEWDRIAREREEPAFYHLKVDTGMGRLGTRAAAAEIIDVIQANRWARLEGLMTHLASPGEFSTTQTTDQVREFQLMREALELSGVRPVYVHLSSTVPVAYRNAAAWGNMVRPGLSIYGYVPAVKGSAPERALTVEPALTWKAAVLSVKEVPAGAPIGYGALYRPGQPARIAVIAAGYADGLPCQLSNRGSVIANGKIVPMIGAVSMDMTTIDLTTCPDIKPGDAVTLIGAEGDVKIDAQDIATLAGTIPYSILCSIHPRVRRVYVS